MRVAPLPPGHEEQNLCGCTQELRCCPNPVLLGKVSLLPDPFPEAPESQFPPTCRQGTHRWGDTSATVGARCPQQPRPQRGQQVPGSGQPNPCPPPQTHFRGFLPSCTTGSPLSQGSAHPSPPGKESSGSRWRRSALREWPRCPRRAEPAWPLPCPGSGAGGGARRPLPGLGRAGRTEGGRARPPRCRASSTERGSPARGTGTEGIAVGTA